jgi:hypothetical protein
LVKISSEFWGISEWNMTSERTFSKDDAFAEYHGEISANFIRLGIVVCVGSQDVVQRSRIREHESVTLHKRHVSNFRSV